MNMKMKTNSDLTTIYNGLLGLFLTLFWIPSHAQTASAIRGKVTDETGQPMAYANIVVREVPDSALVGGTITKEDGTFEFLQRIPGTYLLTASFIGYQPVSATIDVSGEATVDAGTMVMSPERTSIDEVVIRENRMKAKQQVDRTTYYVNSRMRSASQTATELIKLVPGVRVDLFNTISLDGSTQVVILVNGVERDPDYLGQLDPDRIDRVEVQSNGGIRYGAGISGVINVVLREDPKTGINGHVYANIPTKSNEVFSFPSASLNVSLKKTTWYTSYNSGFSYFNIEGMNHKTVSPGDHPVELVRNDRLGQENWSHKVHFGMDRFGDKNNQISLYGFVSGFSNEQDGRFVFTEKNETSDSSTYRMEKDDSDRNKSAFGSIYFRHRLLPGSEIILEGSYYLLRSHHRTDLTDPDQGTLLASAAGPVQDEVNFRALFNSRISDRFRIETGIQQQFQSMKDQLLPSFHYVDRSFAGYVQGAFSGERFQANAGLRAEYSHVTYRDVINEGRLFILPKMDLKYNINEENNVRISYVKRINRPGIHQLNPSPFTPDPLTLHRGNPLLVPEVSRNISATYSRSFQENFLSAALYYRQEEEVIEELTKLTDGRSFLMENQNLGDLNHTGVKVLGSMNLQERFSIQPHVELSHVRTRVSVPGRREGLSARSGWEFRGKVSFLWAIRDDLSLSASVQGQGATMGIQHTYREGVLYFINAEKLFFDRLKIGITSAIPFMRSFTYQGYDIAAEEFTVVSEDNIQMSVFPVWIKLKYSFASGKKVRRLERDDMFEEHRVKKGF